MTDEAVKNGVYLRALATEAVALMATLVLEDLPGSKSATRRRSQWPTC